MKKQKNKIIIILTTMLFFIASVFLLSILSGQEKRLKVTDNHILQIENAENGCNYEVFQIFTGKISDKDGLLANLRYGKNYGYEGTSVDDSIAKMAMNGEIGDEDIIGEPIAILSTKQPSIELEEGFYAVMEGENTSMIALNQTTFIQQFS